MISIKDFKQLGIEDRLLQILSEQYIVEPTKIQEKAIPYILKNRDIIGKAQTGTGKTLAFLLPIVQQLNPEIATTQALILTPTRELALQIAQVSELLLEGTNMSVVAAFGGHGTEGQAKKLKTASQIVVGTPGRILDHLRNGNTNFKHLKKLVIDEADQMMALGFLEDIDMILSKIPRQKNIMIFSATIPEKIRKMARRVMKTAVDIDITPKQLVIEDVDQMVIRTTEARRFDTLKMVLDTMNPFMVMIFCKSRERADNLYETMYQNGLEVEILHGEFSQQKRETIMKKFRDLKFPYLVTTDISARGMDIDGVTHVINYDLPSETDYFVHRVGRTGRAGEKGIAISLVADEDLGRLEKIQKATGVKPKQYYDRSPQERTRLDLNAKTAKKNKAK